MDYNFHYYITYLVARQVGWTKVKAHYIAQCAQMVDETSTEITGNIPQTAEGRDVERTVWSAKALRHAMKASGRREKTALPWMAFHFLPAGRIDHPFRLHWGYLSDRLEASKKADINRLRKRLQVQQRLICAPGSAFAKAMMEDTIVIANLIDAMETDNITSAENVPVEFADNFQMVRNAIREAQNQNGNKPFKHPEIDAKAPFSMLFWRRFAGTLLGIRLHVLADTFAHQGFSGYRTKKLNDAGYLYYEKTIGKGLEKGAWMDVWDGRAPSGNVLGAHIGHGRVGTFPDEAPRKFAYVRGADRCDELSVERNNPEIYAAAAQEMFLALRDMLGWLYPGAKDPRSDDYQRLALDPQFFGNLSTIPIDQASFLETMIRVSARNEYKNFDIRWRGFVHRADPKFTIKGGRKKLREIGANLLTSDDLSYFDVAAKYHKQWFKDKIADFVGAQWEGILEVMRLSNTEEPIDEEEAKMSGEGQVAKKKFVSVFDDGEFFEFDDFEEKKAAPERPSVDRRASKGQVRPRADSAVKSPLGELEEKLSEVEDKYKAGVETWWE